MNLCAMDSKPIFDKMEKPRLRASERTELAGADVAMQVSGGARWTPNDP
jgi:hypothetical protein